MSSYEPLPLNDPRRILALAHPVRFALMRQLAACEAARVSDLARAVGHPANGVSFHLRQLARAEFVEPAPEHATDGRERWWRAKHSAGWRLVGDGVTSPKHLAALELATSMLRADLLAFLDTWFREVEKDDGANRGNGDYLMHLTPGEYQEYRREHLAVTSAWRERSRAPREGTHAYRFVELVLDESALGEQN